MGHALDHHRPTQLLPDASDIDHPTFGPQPAALRPYIMAGARQAWAHAQHFPHAVDSYSGTCGGLCAVWLRMHQAHPDAVAADRVNTTMSFEGMTHAEIYQNSYEFEMHAMDDETYDRHPEHPGFSHHVAHRPMDEAFFGMEKDWSRNTKLDTAGVAEAMARVEGYAVLGWRALDDGRVPSRHQVAMFRDPVNESIHFFDPASGEFILPDTDAQDFLLALQEMHASRAPQGFRFDSFHLDPVRMTGPVSETPLARLAGRLERVGMALDLPEELALGPMAR